ncbi:MAG: serine/threonine protein kinase, partial [Candidatus Omnitrophica bacterium]|nr:serine/threonine protein kinase [Candidatus Omnitrophota bacterium]
MGEVYLAENRHTGWKRALKVLPQELSTKSDFILRFKREAAVLDQLEHPGIVRVREMGEDQGRFYLVMDYIDGPEGKPMTLADHATQSGGPLDPVKLGKILIEVCEALSYAHGKGVIHRDLKPSNILLNHEGRAIVSDFGLARVVGREFLQSRIEESISRSMSIGQGKTMFAPTPVDPSIGQEATGDALGSSSRSILGTWDYMAPEVKDGEEATEKSDIYAVGVILYRLLTGVHQIGFEMPSELVDGLDEEWDRVYRTAAATRPERRYAKCLDLIETVRRQLSTP